MPRHLAFQLVLDRIGGGQNCAGLEEIEHAETIDGGAHDDLGPVDLELRGNDGALHDLQGAEHDLEARGRAARLRARAAGHVHGDEDVGPADQVIEGQRIDGAAVDQDPEWRSSPPPPAAAGRL